MLSWIAHAIALWLACVVVVPGGEGCPRAVFGLVCTFFRNRITVLCVAVVVYRLGGTSDKQSGLKGGLEASVLR